MKIGILTLPLHFNFGGILQAYALQSILERMGHDVVVFGKKRQTACFSIKRIPIYLYRIIKKYVLRKKNVIVFFEAQNYRDFERICENTSAFVKTHINERKVVCFKELKESEFDALVVGSDQIWRSRYVKSSWNTEISNAMLKFAEHWKIKRLSYAASFGTNQWELSPQETNEWRRLISLFNVVSVRERDGVDLCEKYLGVNAKVVLDPTMLLEKEDYRLLLADMADCKPDGDMLNYVLDESDEVCRAVSKIAQKFSMKTFKVNVPADKKEIPVECRIQPSVEQWLNGFDKAKFVITDSFHACVFSIIFKKPFVVFQNESRGSSRIRNLLSMFDLENHLVNENSEILGIQNYEIPEFVYEKVRNMQCASINFLKSALA